MEKLTLGGVMMLIDVSVGEVNSEMLGIVFRLSNSASFCFTYAQSVSSFNEKHWSSIKEGPTENITRRRV